MIAFRDGTPEEPGAALGMARDAQAARAAGQAVHWHVDPANLGLLSRVARTPAPAAMTVILAAEDHDDLCTRVAHEGALVPTLRRLQRLGLSLRLTTGRAYVLPPSTLDLSTNNLCGLACAMCRNRASQRDPRALSADEVNALLGQTAQWGVERVSLTGAGEPFRDPDMLAHMARANGLGLGVAVTSNGVPISDELAARLAERQVSVSISLHGSSPAAHEAVVGAPGVGDRAFQAVHRLVAARDAVPGCKLSVNVSTVIQRANVDQVAALARWALDAGCNGFNVQPINLQHGRIDAGADAGKIVRHDDQEAMATLWPRPDQARAIDKMTDDLRGLTQERPGFVHASPARLDLVRRYFGDPSRAGLGTTCQVGHGFLGIDHLGTIKPCYRVPWNVGEVRQVSISALWNSRRYDEIRRQIATCPLTCLNNCFFRERRPS